MAMLKRLAVLAGAAGAVTSYAKKNPEKVNQAVGKAAQFVDQKTKGKYHAKINGVTQKVSDVTKPKPGH
ncbi:MULTISPECIES: antitoxin [unclassified Amycolatopsis]|uniref:antitoxin n=1 Tax=unclassified Amycolatopsis TaxID=2618356 RepID=UPI001C694AD6|nr:antitoxin [Amycolatopsis sp. DSM 110486]QYN26636.1 antitoxin [Amycolatopsis sp. DSM 110486]